MTLFCPHCNATLVYPLTEVSFQTCAVCGARVPFDADRLTQQELEARVRAEGERLANLRAREDDEFAGYIRRKLEPRLVKLIDEFRFHVGRNSLPHPTREQVVEIAATLFRENVEQVLPELDQYGVEPHHAERERVHLALLRLSDGDRSRLTEQLAIAKTDFREVLVAAEIPLSWTQWRNPAVSLDEAQRWRLAEYDLMQYLEWLAGRVSARDAART